MPPRTPDAEHPHLPEAEPASPTIPSLASLRDPRRRTAVDLLVPAAPRSADPSPRPDATRPPEWGDLLLLGVHVARRALACLRRLV
jgi:hypothetical protein